MVRSIGIACAGQLAGEHKNADFGSIERRSCAPAAPPLILSNWVDRRVRALGAKLITTGRLVGPPLGCRSVWARAQAAQGAAEVRPEPSVR
jgi:hypothetical protein